MQLSTALSLNLRTHSYGHSLLALDDTNPTVPDSELR